MRALLEALATGCSSGSTFILPRRARICWQAALRASAASARSASVLASMTNCTITPSCGSSTSKASAWRAAFLAEPAPSCTSSTNLGTAVLSPRPPSARANSACTSALALGRSRSKASVGLPRCNWTNARRAAFCSTAFVEVAATPRSGTIVSSPRIPKALIAASLTSSEGLRSITTMVEAAETSPRWVRPSSNAT